MGYLTSFFTDDYVVLLICQDVKGTLYIFLSNLKLLGIQHNKCIIKYTMQTVNISLT